MPDSTNDPIIECDRKYCQCSEPDPTKCPDSYVCKSYKYKRQREQCESRCSEWCVTHKGIGIPPTTRPQKTAPELLAELKSADINTNISNNDISNILQTLLFTPTQNWSDSVKLFLQTESETKEGNTTLLDIQNQYTQSLMDYEGFLVSTTFIGSTPQKTPPGLIIEGELEEPSGSNGSNLAFITIEELCKRFIGAPLPKDSPDTDPQYLCPKVLCTLMGGECCDTTNNADKAFKCLLRISQFYYYRIPSVLLLSILANLKLRPSPFENIPTLWYKLSGCEKVEKTRRKACVRKYLEDAIARKNPQELDRIVALIKQTLEIILNHTLGLTDPFKSWLQGLLDLINGGNLTQEQIIAIMQALLEIQNAIERGQGSSGSL